MYKNFKDLQNGDRFLIYASAQNYASAKHWRTATGSAKAINATLWKIPTSTGMFAYGNPNDSVEFE